MELSNEKRSRKIKQSFNYSMVLILLAALFFVWKEMDLAAIITAGVLVLLIVASQFINLNYIYYSSEGAKLLVRYYPIITFWGKEYSSVEFNKALLHQAEIKKTFVFSDLYLAVKTRDGIAEYPEISLSALSKKQLKAVKADLDSLPRAK